MMQMSNCKETCSTLSLYKVLKVFCYSRSLALCYSHVYFNACIYGVATKMVSLAFCNTSFVFMKNIPKPQLHLPNPLLSKNPNKQFQELCLAMLLSYCKCKLYFFLSKCFTIEAIFKIIVYVQTALWYSQELGIACITVQNIHLTYHLDLLL